MNEICSICGVSRKLVSKFYLNSEHGVNLCNKHYLQIKNKGMIVDISQPKIEDKRTYWTEEEKNKLEELVKINIPTKEIAEMLNKTVVAIRKKIIRMNLNLHSKNSTNFKAIYQDYDWCYKKYIIEGLSHEEMAIEAKSTKRVIEKWCTDKHRLTKMYRKNNQNLNNEQKDLVIGSMLGDGHIDKRKDFPIFIVAHAENQKDYLYFKYEIMKDLCNIPPVKKDSYTYNLNGRVYNCQASYRLATRVLSCLDEYRNKSYTHLLNQLNEFSFSIWVLDDASRSNSNWTLCVAEYTKNDLNFAIQLFKNRYNLNAKIQKDERYLIFDAVSSRKIDEIILKNIPNDLDIIKYKITQRKYKSEGDKNKCSIL